MLHAGQTGDFFPHHMDAEWCKTQDFKQRIAHGTLIFSVGVGMTANEINPEAMSYGYLLEVFNQNGDVVLVCDHLLIGHDHTAWLDLDYKPKLPKDKTRGIGIIGAGGIVKSCHLPAYRMAGFRVVGIYDLDAKKAQELAAQFQIQHVFASMEALLNHPEIEVVDIAVPAKYQPDVVELAAKKGKHILCQKPLGETYDYWFTPQLEGRWFPHAFMGTMGELLRAIEEDREPNNSVVDNLDTIRMVFASYRSIAEHRSVRLDEFE